MTDDIRARAIEAAARAIVRAEGGDPDARIDKGFVAQGVHVTTFSQIAWREAEPLARAAIAAYERAMWRPIAEAPKHTAVQAVLDAIKAEIESGRGTMPDEMKIWIAVRTDLEMPAGKMAAMVAHAAVTTVYRQTIINRGLIDEYMATSQAKIVLRCDTDKEMSDIAADCATCGVPAEIITTAGRTIFNRPTRTCIAIGPATTRQVPPIVRALRLL